jgi:hypothetical protein
LLSERFLYAGLTSHPEAGAFTFKTDQGHKESFEPQVALIEGPSDVFPSADDDIW